MIPPVSTERHPKRWRLETLLLICDFYRNPRPLFLVLRVNHHLEGEFIMRVTDHRYTRDRMRFDLALRFIRHEARTHTIRAWTGLSDDRIRKLHRTYLEERSCDLGTRPRGKSPTQSSYFTRATRVQQQTALFTSLCCLLGVIPDGFPPDTARVQPGVARGELLCQAFEAYRAFVSVPHLSFEHAVFLVNTLMRGDDLRITGCSECSGLMVVDRLIFREPLCWFCARPDSACMTPQKRAAQDEANRER